MEVKRNDDVIKYMLNAFGYEVPEPMVSLNKVYTLAEADKVDNMYQCIKNLDWTEAIDGEVIAISIEKVFNPYTLALYNLKKLEMNCDEVDLWHGAVTEKIDEICKHNFDYRTAKQHLFGKGISFSTKLSYEFDSGDSNKPWKMHNYSTLFCKVLKKNVHNGNKTTTYPMEGYDSTMKPSGDEIDKYDDDTFYPMYKVCFTVEEYFDIYVSDSD